MNLSNIPKYELELGADGRLLYVSISAAQRLAADEATDHKAWVADVTTRLRSALEHAAAGEPFDWDKPRALRPRHTRGLGRLVAGMSISPSVLKAAAEWEVDVTLYGRPDVLALQQMAAVTPYSRRDWIFAWTQSRIYRAASYRGEIPNLTTWIDPMRELITRHHLYRAAALQDAADERREAAANRAFEHFLMVQIMKAFRIRRPHDLGIRTTGCACHPASWSYGPEYARRRRHRNRRRHR
jgi:hypothetical protein